MVVSQCRTKNTQAKLYSNNRFLWPMVVTIRFSTKNRSYWCHYKFPNREFHSNITEPVFGTERLSLFVLWGEGWKRDFEGQFWPLEASRSFAGGYELFVWEVRHPYGIFHENSVSLFWKIQNFYGEPSEELEYYHFEGILWIIEEILIDLLFIGRLWDSGGSLMACMFISR